MRYFFRRRVPEYRRVLFIESGSRRLAEGFLPGFYQSHPEARVDLARFCKQAGLGAIQLGEQDSKLGGVETLADARKCAELFKRHADELDGIVVVLPNFGDEKGVTEVLRLSGLKLPVLLESDRGELSVSSGGSK